MFHLCILQSCERNDIIIIINFNSFCYYNVGRTAGGAYAGASAGYGTGASTAIGGSVDEFGQSGGHGSEAHINGLSTKTVQLSQYPQGPQNQQVIYLF